MTYNTNDTVIATSEHLDLLRRDAEAFALEQHREDGSAIPLDWIVHPGLVRQVADELAMEKHSPIGINADLTQTLFVRTRSGRKFACSLAEVRPGSAGFVVFGDGHLRPSSGLQYALGAAYQRPDYDSSADALRRSAPPLDTSRFPVARPRAQEDAQKIALYCHQDNPDADWNERYAQAHATSANTEAFELKGLGSLVDELVRLQGEDKVVSVLVVAAHGSDAGVRIGAKDEPFRGPTRVGYYDNQVSPTRFGEALAPYLAKGAEIVLLTCYTARRGVGPERDGPRMIQQVADAAVAKLGASDAAVAISGSTASTEGDWLVATPAGDHPHVARKAPAGIIDPPPASGR